MFGLKDHEIKAIGACFARYPGIQKVIIFGSRAKDTFKTASDIDLCIFGSIDFKSLSQLENQMDDLLLPYKIDLIVYDRIRNEEFIQSIIREGKRFYPL